MILPFSIKIRSKLFLGGDQKVDSVGERWRNNDEVMLPVGIKDRRSELEFPWFLQNDSKIPAKIQDSNIHAKEGSKRQMQSCFGQQQVELVANAIVQAADDLDLTLQVFDEIPHSPFAFEADLEGVFDPGGVTPAHLCLATDRLGQIPYLLVFINENVKKSSDHLSSKNRSIIVLGVIEEIVEGINGNGAAASGQKGFVTVVCLVFDPGGSVPPSTQDLHPSINACRVMLVHIRILSPKLQLLLGFGEKIGFVGKPFDLGESCELGLVLTAYQVFEDILLMNWVLWIARDELEILQRLEFAATYQRLCGRFGCRTRLHQNVAATLMVCRLGGGGKARVEFIGACAVWA